MPITKNQKNMKSINKTYQLKASLMLLLMLFSLNSAMAQQSDEARRQAEKLRNADREFYDFLSQFRASREFQYERTIKKLRAEFDADEWDFSWIKIVYDRLPCGYGSNSFLQKKSTTEYVYFVGWFEYEISTRMRFKKINGKWLLTEYVNFGNLITPEDWEFFRKFATNKEFQYQRMVEPLKTYFRKGEFTIQHFDIPCCKESGRNRFITRNRLITSWTKNPNEQRWSECGLYFGWTTNGKLTFQRTNNEWFLTGFTDFSSSKSLSGAIAQQRTQTPEREEVIFTIVARNPEFPGGQQALYQFLSENIRYPILAVENRTQGRVVLQFVVNTDGSIVDIQVARSVCPLLDREAIRVVQSMPKWRPGESANGELVRTRFTLPINFRLN